MHDASYYEVIELRAHQAVLVSLLDLCCESSASLGSVRYLTGSRACEALLYMPGSYPYDLAGPVTVLWRPTASQDSDNLAHSPRTVWIVCHPSIFESAFQSLSISSSFAVEASKSDDRKKHKVEVVDLRGKFNVFELMGPKSSQVVKGALVPVLDDRCEELNQVSPVLSPQRSEMSSNVLEFWSGLQRLQCPGGLPSGMVIGLKVHDPRLRSVLSPRFMAVPLTPISFPPVNAAIQVSEVLAPQQLVEPSPDLACCEIWDTTSIPSGAPRFTKKDIDGRRAKVRLPTIR